MSFNVTTKRDIVHPLQYVAEGTSAATYGLRPSSPTFIAAGLNVEITLDPNIISEKVMALGLEDYADSIKTQENFAFSLKSNIFNTTLAKYGIQAANGAGTIGEHLTFLFSKKLDGTTNYTEINGCKAISTTLSVARGLWELDMTFHCQEILDETVSTIAGATYVTTPPSTTPFTHQDGASPFNWNSVVTFERSFNMTVTRDLSLLEINGDVLVQFAKASQRNISFNVEVYKKAATILTDYYNATQRTATYKIGASDVATFTNAKIVGYTESHSGTNTGGAIENLSCESESVNIA